MSAFAELCDIQVADHTQDDSIEQIAARILAAAPPKFALAGLSMGGYIAFEIVHQAPERVERLALLDTTARSDTPEKATVRRDWMALCRRGNFVGVTERFLPLLIHPSRTDDTQLVETIFQMSRDVGPDAFLRQQTALLNRNDRRGMLNQIRCPTVIICGRQDLSTPLEWHVEMAAGIPNSSLRVVEECGHLSTLECPNEVNAHLANWMNIDPAKLKNP